MGNKVYPTIKDSIFLCLLYLCIWFGYIVLTYNFSDNDSLYQSIISILGTLTTFGIVLLIGFKKAKRKFNDVFKFNKTSPFLWVAMTVFMVGFVILLSEFDNLLSLLLPMPEALRNVPIGHISLLEIIRIFLPILMWELLFFGLILDGLSRNYSKWKAIVFCAFLSGIIFIFPWYFFSLFFMGLISAWICIETKSILLCIYIRLFNTILYIITVSYGELIPIRGFNNNYATQVEFQPVWFTLFGVGIMIIGILMLKNGIQKTKTSTQKYTQS
jgi:membrane protease YdiL (CAAX protease family)